jgi:hypothetical protein
MEHAMSSPTDLDIPPTPRQRSARTDPDLRDGDSAHGNPYEPAADERALDSDADLEDATAADEAREQLTGREPEAAGVVGLETEPEMPVVGYGRLTIPEVMERVNGLSADELERVISYEAAHRNRKTLLAKLRKLAERA